MKSYFKLKNLSLVNIVISTNYLGIVIQFLTIGLITNNFNIQIYGEFRSIINLITVLYLFVILGKDNYLLYLKNKNYDNLLNQEIKTSIVTTFILFAITLLLLKPIKYYFDNISYNNLLALSPIILLWSIFNISTSILKIIDQSKIAFLLTNLIQRLLRLLIIIFLIYFGFHSVFSLGLSFIIPLVILIIFTSYYIFENEYKLASWRVYNIKFILLGLKNSIYFGVNILIIELLVRTDTLIISYFMNNTDVALYDIAFSVSMIMYVPINSYSRSVETNTHKYFTSDYTQSLKKIFFISSFIIILINLTSSTILIFFGSDYLLAENIIVTFSLFYLIYTILGAPVEFLSMNGKSLLVSKIYLLTIFFNILFGVVLVNYFGLIGGAIASGTSLVLSKGLALYYSSEMGMIIDYKDFFTDKNVLLCLFGYLITLFYCII